MDRRVHQIPHLVPSQVLLPVRQALPRGRRHPEVRLTTAVAQTAAGRQYSAPSSVVWHEGVDNTTTRVEVALVMALHTQALAQDREVISLGDGVIMLTKDTLESRNRKGKPYVWRPQASHSCIWSYTSICIIRRTLSLTVYLIL